MYYLEGQADLVSRPVSAISHIKTPPDPQTLNWVGAKLQQLGTCCWEAFSVVPLQVLLDLHGSMVLNLLRSAFLWAYPEPYNRSKI